MMFCPRRSEVPSTFKLPEQDEWRDGRCSFCGSLSPEKFFAAIEAGVELGPTDKNYKVYVDFGAHGSSGKFYFQHLDEAQKRHFVELLNAKTLTIGYPGHFDVQPFFVEMPGR